MCYLNGKTDRDYTQSNRQVVHKYGLITLLAANGYKTTEKFNDSYQQAQLERKFRRVRTEEFNDEATIYLTFRYRMDTKKAQTFLEEVAEKAGFNLEQQFLMNSEENSKAA